MRQGLQRPQHVGAVRVAVHDLYAQAVLAGLLVDAAPARMARRAARLRRHQVSRHGACVTTHCLRSSARHKSGSRVWGGGAGPPYMHSAVRIRARGGAPPNALALPAGALVRRRCRRRRARLLEGRSRAQLPVQRGARLLHEPRLGRRRTPRVAGLPEAGRRRGQQCGGVQAGQHRVPDLQQQRRLRLQRRLAPGGRRGGRVRLCDGGAAARACARLARAPG
jgi:hypothetical protein